MVKIKICGITSMEDAACAVEAGASALGFVFYKPSPRFVGVEVARRIIASVPPFIASVGIFVNEEASRINEIARICCLDRIQLHGDERPDFCRSLERRVIKAIRLKDKSSLELMKTFDVTNFLLDTYSDKLYGGSGSGFDWELAIEAAKLGRIILAGGLTPENVADAIRRVRPYGVDVSTGVEIRPGKKDPRKIAQFIKSATGA